MLEVRERWVKCRKSCRVGVSESFQGRVWEETWQWSVQRVGR